MPPNAPEIVPDACRSWITFPSASREDVIERTRTVPTPVPSVGGEAAAGVANAIVPATRAVIIHLPRICPTSAVVAAAPARDRRITPVIGRIASIANVWHRLRGSFNDVPRRRIRGSLVVERLPVEAAVECLELEA